MSFVRQQLDRLQQYDEVAEISGIARRSFANNSFDGILTMIGVLMGNLAAGVLDARVVISTGLATSLSIGVSGLWGAYMAETAERSRSLGELENHTLSDLSDTRIGRASRMAVLVVALIDGLSPLVSSVLVLIPMFMSGSVGVVPAYYISLGLSLALLFLLGAILGLVGKQSIVVAGAKMISGGVVAILLSYALRLVIQ